MRPKVTIVIPVFNGANYLRDAIDSALSQTYQNVEILVINDGSNDDRETERIALSYGDNIRYFEKSNGGVASALNRAVVEMTGEYFSWLSHDDLYCIDKIEKEVIALNKFGRDDIVIYSDFSVFTTNTGTEVPVRMREVLPEHFRYWLTLESSLHGCTLLIPRTAFNKCGLFNECLRTTQDYDLWFRMAEQYRFIHVTDVLVRARSHSNQGSLNMPKLALAESSALHTNFVSNLTVEEIASAEGRPIGVAYLRIASSMWRRGFVEAGDIASRLARKNGVTEFRIYRMMSISIFQMLVIRYSRIILDSRIRLMLRGIWRRFNRGRLFL